MKYFVKLIYFQYPENEEHKIGFSAAKADAAYESVLEQELDENIIVNSIGCSVNIKDKNSINTNFANFLNEIKE